MVLFSPCAVCLPILRTKPHAVVRFMVGLNVALLQNGGANNGGILLVCFATYWCKMQQTGVEYGLVCWMFLALFLPPFTAGICQFMASFVESIFNVFYGIAMVMFLCF